MHLTLNTVTSISHPLSMENISHNPRTRFSYQVRMQPLSIASKNKASCGGPPSQYLQHPVQPR